MVSIAEHLTDLPQMMADMCVPGVSIAHPHSAQTAETATFGVMRAGCASPVARETVFQAASISKPVFAYVVCSLVEEGVLDLDRPLSLYGAEPFVIDDPLLEQVSARHVLSHTTGWPNWRPKGEPLVREAAPGERYGYSGEGFVYLQRVVEHLTGQDLEALARARVLEPLGMRSSSFGWPADGDPLLATGHDARGTPLDQRQPESPNAAYSLHTTATDIGTFIAALLRGASTAMLVPQVLVNDHVSWSLGWGLETSRGTGHAFWHWGDNPGYKSFAIGLLDAGTGAVVMTNADGGRPLCAWVVQRLLGTDHPALDWLARRYQHG